LKYAMIIDVNRCSICYSCEMACKDEFVGNVYPPFSHSQTDRQPAWIRTTEIEKGKYPHVKVYPVTTLCMLCENAPCMKVCPIPGCMYKTETGVVILDPAKCNGCQACQKACPYDAINFNDDKNICQKCTLCQHKLKEGKQPACIDACPSGVFYLDEESKVMEMAEKRNARQMHPEYQTGPKVYYIGLPSISLAGHLIDSKTLMDINDVEVTLTDTRTGSVSSVKSNASGNFLIQNLQKGNSYKAKVACKGYQTKIFDKIVLDIEYNHLGNIKMEKVLA
jgi:tetrathionate reductase subunit B